MATRSRSPCASAAARWRTRIWAGDLLERVADDIEEIGKVEAMPKMEGRQMVMMINPLK